MVTSIGKQINVGAKSTEFVIVFWGAEVEGMRLGTHRGNERKELIKATLQP